MDIRDERLKATTSRVAGVGGGRRGRSARYATWAAYGLAFATLVGCASAVEEGGAPGKVTVEAAEQQGLLTFDALEKNRVAGSYVYRGETLHFESEANEGIHYVTLDVRGMVLSATIDTSGASDLDGFKLADGSDTAMTVTDRALVHAFDSALADTYRNHAGESPALAMFGRALALWSDYPDTVPLRRVYFARAERRGSGQNLCGRVNRPGQGDGFSPIWSWASHDCTTIKGIFTTDCGPLSGGCAYGNDSSTVDNVFMSMHPHGGCADGRYYGTSATSFQCYEPDHDANIEFAYGNCFGRCGGDCGSSSQFTQACLDHDLCVTFGHWTYNPLSSCDDEFTEAAVDYLYQPDCGGEFQIDYNWAGPGHQGPCKPAWHKSNEGCDVGCQFVDPDCFR